MPSLGDSCLWKSKIKTCAIYHNFRIFRKFCGRMTHFGENTELIEHDPVNLMLPSDSTKHGSILNYGPPKFQSYENSYKSNPRKNSNPKSYNFIGWKGSLDLASPRSFHFRRPPKNFCYREWSIFSDRDCKNAQGCLVLEILAFKVSKIKDAQSTILLEYSKNVAQGWLISEKIPNI